MQRLLYFLDNRRRDGGEIFSLMLRPRSRAQDDSWYSFMLETELKEGRMEG
jgi:hypothetical protein